MENNQLVPAGQAPADLAPPIYERVNLDMAMSMLAKHSRTQYQAWIVRFVSAVRQEDPALYKHAIREFPIREVVPCLEIATYKAWLGTLKQGTPGHKPLGKQAIDQAAAAIVWIAQLCADLHLVPYSTPASISRVKKPRAEKGQRQGKWLSKEEIGTLILAARNAKGPRTRVIRNLSIVTLLSITGLRRDELAEARWTDIEKQSGYAFLRVHGKGEKIRLVKLPDIALRTLDAWRELQTWPSEFIFCGLSTGGKPVRGRTGLKMSDRQVWVIVKSVAKQAGLPDLSPHDLRRSFAKGAFEAGVSYELIKQALGHSNIATTERYVNAAFEIKRTANDVWADEIEKAGER